MPIPTKVAQGNIICAYASRPEIINNGQRLGKNVESMSYLDATELKDVVNPDKDKTLGLFFTMSVHERHLVGLPLVKVPYTTTFPKTCEQADRHHNTYLAIAPTENIVRLPSTAYVLDALFNALTIPDFPPIAKQMTMGKTLDEVDAYIDLAMPVVIREAQVEWTQNMYIPAKADVKRVLKAYRFVNGLNDGLTPEELEKEPEGRSAPRPISLLGPGAYLRNDDTVSHPTAKASKLPPHLKVLRNHKPANAWQARNPTGNQRGSRGGGRAGRNMQNNKSAPWSGQQFNKALALTYLNPELNKQISLASTPGKEATAPDTDCSFDRERKAELLDEPWPEEWVKTEMSPVVEGLQNLAVRESGWDQPEKNMPVHVHVQQWLGLEGEERKYKGWEFPEKV